MVAYEFVIPGKPARKERPRVSVRGKLAHAYTPKATVQHENTIGTLALQAGVKVQECALTVEIEAVFAIPAKTAKKSLSAIYGSPFTHMPDWDNIAKLVCDALNRIAWLDDKQIVSAIVTKRYCRENESPHTRVAIGAD